MSGTTAEVLRKAADRLEKPGAWFRHGYGNRVESSLAVPPVGELEASTCWCALGAITLEYGDDFPDAGHPECSSAGQMLVAEIGGRSVAQWNDAPGRTQAEVVAALRAAAERAEKAVSDVG